MPVTLIDKIKPKGNFPLVDAADVLMPNGERLSEVSINGGEGGQNGQDGKDGQDGFSPVVTVTEIEGGHEVSITDATGTKTFDVMDGKDGSGGSGGGLPDVTADDNGKIVQVVDGVWTVLAIADSSVKTYIDEYINEALGGEY